MEQGSQGTRVSPGEQRGSGQNGMPDAFQRDVGTDDLDQRFAKRLEETASGFRSVLDKQVGPLRPLAQVVPQLQQEIQRLAQQQQALIDQLTREREATLEPEEIKQRQDLRQAQKWADERGALVLATRQSNAAWEVMRTIADFGFKWGDERLDWENNLYATDPDAWARRMVASASQQYAQGLEAKLTQQTQERSSDTQERRREQQQREQTIAQNAQRESQARNTETALPGGAQADWQEKYAAMDPEKRRDWMSRTQRKIARGEIKYPWEAI